MKRTVCIGTIDTKLGVLGAVVTDLGLALLTFPSDPVDECEMWIRKWEPSAGVISHSPLLDEVRNQLSDYFAGRLRTFTLPLDMRGTPFQKDVWQALPQIPYGTTVSYGQVANMIGKPKAVRAVGAANGANPVPIIVPCHRVIGSNGKLTGYTGGLSIKQFLLELEGVHRFAAEFTVS
ncbi:methylated-DNA--[protein]-cysteine S-methyltransferase [Effusibacillus dendaii]|uniref:Methylated-DNA--protein-cysteine methyltransferase n=1 Tax=Effusibacillus dendaii TaxID=2743772 RepID=A0A7I8D5P4_9BACL|nr:methylated-DNA--[protein]-cysteine S-methyltransferase [Effusibacillus dendaii]BCJ85478.1 methylated-DNA--protein-cysteine methyltransferase [Effusibacillus dendaii]